MTTLDFYKQLCTLIPAELSCSWDHDGLEVCPDPDAEVKKVLISLDVTDEVIDKAIKDKADVIIAHHPIFFNGVERVSTEDICGARAVRLIRAGIAVMTFHTRLDAAKDGVNDTLAARIGLENVEVIGADKIGRVGELAEEMDGEEFARLVKFALHAPCVTLSDCGKKVKRVALVGGSGGDEIGVGIEAGADTYLTGELKYHQIIAPGDCGMNLVCAGHFYTEYPVTEYLANLTKQFCPNASVEIFFSDRVEVF